MISEAGEPCVRAPQSPACYDENLCRLTILIPLNGY